MWTKMVITFPLNFPENASQRDACAVSFLLVAACYVPVPASLTLVVVLCFIFVVRIHGAESQLRAAPKKK